MEGETITPGAKIALLNSFSSEDEFHAESNVLTPYKPIDKSKIKESHLQFINLVAEGRTQSDSYRLSIAKGKEVNNDGVRSRSCTLAKRYAAEIQAVRDARHAELERAKNIAINNAALEAYNSVYSVTKVDSLLCEIMSAEDSTKQDKLRAMDIYYRRFGLNKPVEQKVTITKVGVEKENEEYL